MTNDKQYQLSPSPSHGFTNLHGPSKCISRDMLCMNLEFGILGSGFSVQPPIKYVLNDHILFCSADKTECDSDVGFAKF